MACLHASVPLCDRDSPGGLRDTDGHPCGDRMFRSRASSTHVASEIALRGADGGKRVRNWPGRPGWLGEREGRPCTSLRCGEEWPRRIGSGKELLRPPSPPSLCDDPSSRWRKSSFKGDYWILGLLRYWRACLGLRHTYCTECQSPQQPDRTNQPPLRKWPWSFLTTLPTNSNP